jgi:hypothetical protein
VPAMKIYIIVFIAFESDISIEPLGAFSSLKKAEMYVKELETFIDKYEESNFLYDIIDYDLDSEPPLLKWFKSDQQERYSSVEQDVLRLVDKGFVDQLVGEDGNFYYEPTKIGNQSPKIKKAVDSFNKIFKKQS